MTSLPVLSAGCSPDAGEQPRGGVITNISTVGSIRYPGIAYAGDAASKGALNQLTQTIAVEHAAHNIRGFAGDAFDVANATVFLANDQARDVNGHLLVVDDGLSVRCA